MADELPTVDASIKCVDLADIRIGALEDELMLFSPRSDEGAHIVEVGSLKDHADDLARGGGEGRMITHDMSNREASLPF